MAYVILCHKNPKQVNTLIERLNNEYVEFFLHIDKKSSIQQEIKQKNNIHFVDPINVYWGHYGQIECILNCYKAIKEKGYFNYVHVLSGQDMPIKSNETIINFFKENQGKEFVHFGKTDINHHFLKNKLYERVSVYYPKFLTSRNKKIKYLRFGYVKFIMLTKLFKRKLNDLPDMIYYGANWMSITGGCMEYILEYVKAHSEYVNFFKNTFCGDELFFQTIILNSKYKDNVVDSTKRYVDWDTGPDYPRTLTLKDVERIKNKGTDKFWARKFDISLSDKIVESIFRDIESENS